MNSVAIHGEHFHHDAINTKYGDIALVSVFDVTMSSVMNYSSSCGEAQRLIFGD